MLFVCYERCTTCQKARKFLQENNVPFAPRDIRDDHPTREELSAWHAMSGLPLRKFFNTSGLAYKALSLKDRLPGMSEDEMLDLLASDGMLVKRPLLITDATVLVGFKEAAWKVALGI